MEPASSRWLQGSSRPKWHPEDPEKTPAGHGATKPSVSPCVVKTKMAPPKTWKRHPRVMEPPRPLWLHGSPRPKWHPEDHEKAPAGHGTTKASVAPWLFKTKMAPRRLGRRQSGATRTRLDEGFETFIRVKLLSTGVRLMGASNS